MQMIIESTLKPIDKEALIQLSNKVQSVITLEEHTIVGGLGSACAELILEEGINIKNFKRIGINDLFPSGYGSQADMMKRNGLSVENVISTIKKFK